MSSLDSSIVSTALPTISSEFKSDNEYTWILTAYYLGDMAFEPSIDKPNINLYFYLKKKKKQF